MFDRPQPIRLWVWVLLLCSLSIQGVWAASDEEDSNAAPAAASTSVSAEGADTKTAKRKITIPNKRCLKCHADEDEKTSEREDGTTVNIYVDQDQFEASVHGKQPCIGCHNSITKAQHDQPLPKSIGCVECHREKWKEQLGSDDPKYKRLDVVISQIDSYMRSIHARPNLKDQSRTNATCYDCHDAHNIGTIGSIQRAEHRQKNPEVCGRCHEEQKDTYKTSIHGKALLEKHNADSAVCSDCHTTHNIDSPEQDAVKLTITQNCGRCHEKQVKTYRASYHGQVTRLGYAHTAKCFDCHGSHGIMAVKDPRSKVHDNNRLETCRQCHKNAPEGYLGFHAHGDVNDYEHFPEMWIAKRLMDVLILGVFLFFWTHMLLWIYREWRDGKEGKGYRHNPDVSEQVYFRRFTAGWRLIHGILAIAVMTLVLTGTSVLFSGQAWAQATIQLIGGPKVAAIVHRTAALTFIVIFFGHLVVVGWNIFKQRKTFRWFGPTSLVPNVRDFKDIALMFKWFLGFAPRPRFDRWTYWEKFDYWAPFWGMVAIGLSGLMLWFPTVTASFLPGWVFNVATIVHAEEAILAAVFLFTVHYFNVHFRPEKFPMDIVMVTGAVPIEEFRHEHPLEYERLSASGQLEKYLIKRPSLRATRRGRRLTGLFIVIGLLLVVLVITGYLEMLK